MPSSGTELERGTHPFRQRAPRSVHAMCLISCAAGRARDVPIWLGFHPRPVTSSAALVWGALSRAEWRCNGLGEREGRGRWSTSGGVHGLRWSRPPSPDEMKRGRTRPHLEVASGRERSRRERLGHTLSGMRRSGPAARGRRAVPAVRTSTTTPGLNKGRPRRAPWGVSRSGPPATTLRPNPRADEVPNPQFGRVLGRCSVPGHSGGSSLVTAREATPACDVKTPLRSPPYPRIPPRVWRW